MCTCANLRKATRVVTQLFDAALKPVGLTPSQFTLLAALDKRGPIAQSALADALVMERTTLIRNLRPLVARGLVATETGGGRGVKTLSLTGAGATALGDALPRWRAAQARIVDALGERRWDGLIANLQSAVAAAEPR